MFTQTPEFGRPRVRKARQLTRPALAVFLPFHLAMASRFPLCRARSSRLRSLRIAASFGEARRSAGGAKAADRADRDSLKAVPYRSRSNHCEILIGRGLAMCVHPVAAWRCGSLRARLVVVAAYFAASYAVILSALAL
jgi:hypothetical protein